MNLCYRQSSAVEVHVVLPYMVVLRSDHELGLHKFFWAFLRARKFSWFLFILRSRWPEMKKINPSCFEFARAKMREKSVVMHYFTKIESCLKKHNLLDKPHLPQRGWECYNLWTQAPLPSPSINSRADHCPPAVTSGKGWTLTLVGCGSVALSFFSHLHQKLMLTLELILLNCFALPGFVVWPRTCELR